jgi:hypothetical protein
MRSTSWRAWRWPRRSSSDGGRFIPRAPSIAPGLRRACGDEQFSTSSQRLSPRKYSRPLLCSIGFQPIVWALDNRFLATVTPVHLRDPRYELTQAFLWRLALWQTKHLYPLSCDRVYPDQSAPTTQWVLWPLVVITERFGLSPFVKSLSIPKADKNSLHCASSFEDTNDSGFWVRMVNKCISFGSAMLHNLGLVCCAAEKHPV